MSGRVFVGFGFGAIQAGLFVYEAFRSGNFQRLVVAEVVPEIVAALRRTGGQYRVNIAGRTGVAAHEVQGVEILNPNVPEDARKLEEALERASEIATALPSVDFYKKGQPTVAGFIERALRRKAADPSLPRCVVYTAENNNHAAEILLSLCEAEASSGDAAPSSRAGVVLGGGGQILNTVIGKMSGVVTDAREIASANLAPLADGIERAILVEEFNRILITHVELPNFDRGIRVFVEKPDLLPFEEAKLYGHNAVHALLGYLAQRAGCRFMSEAAEHGELMTLAHDAFLEESGAALIARHQGGDRLFTAEGYRKYAEDLLERMTNPYLRDSLDRVTRDPRRKLGWDDRLVGTMRLCLEAGVKCWRFALGAAAALETLAPQDGIEEVLNELWPASAGPPARRQQVISLIEEAGQRLANKQLSLRR